MKSPYVLPEMSHDPGSMVYIEKLTVAHLIFVSEAREIVETGSFKGQTTKFISEFLFANDLDGTIASFDIPEMIDKLLEEDPYFLTATNVRLIKGHLPGTLKDYLKNLGRPVDFAIVDSEHSYVQVSAELKVLAPYLGDDAYVVCHDYRPSDETYSGVVRAVDEFQEKEGYELLSLCGKKVWGLAILRKRIRG